MAKRPARGRGLFYTRDSGGRHETTPGQYVLWARQEAEQLGVAFRGTHEQIERMIRDGLPAEGDVFLDYGVQGNRLDRPGLSALIRTAEDDPEVSHLFIPRRDRLARPDEAIDGLRLEHELRRSGLTIVFMDRSVSALAKGGKRDVGEQILAMLEYSNAGEFRRDLAQKMIYAQLSLARDGRSGGGRPPYGFRRWLAREDGTPVRELAERERVRMPGHHVVWVPGPEEELAVIHRILAMLESGKPANRVAAALTAEGVPPPDAGRMRTDRGVRHATSGVWHQTTVVNIARNPLLAAVVTYGRRSMGDRLRFTPDGPRELKDADYRPDGRPKVVANPVSARVTAPAQFEPLIDPEAHGRLLRELDARGGTQRGKARSRDPRKNPMGGRVFDMACGWPMYREPYLGSFRYTCGLYQQSHGERCAHNAVAGPQTARFLLNAIRQRVLSPRARDGLRERLLRLAAAEAGSGPSRAGSAARRARLAELERQLDLAATNMTLAEDDAQRRAMRGVFDRLSRERDGLRAEFEAAEAVGPARDPEAEAEAALAQLDGLGELADDPENLEAIGELFRGLGTRLFLRFHEVPWGKRKVNRVSGGVVTFGDAPPPITLYAGRTSRPEVLALMPPPSRGGIGVDNRSQTQVHGREGDSSGNVSRGGGI
jgi:hypothetical protein